MNATQATPLDAARDRWIDACGAAIFLSFLIIVGYVLCPPLLGLELPYAGGGAVVLSIGASVGLAIRSWPTRLAATLALLGLLGLRVLSAIRPDWILTEHGELSALDGSALALLILPALWMLGVAARRPASGANPPLQPSASNGR